MFVAERLGIVEAFLKRGSVSIGIVPMAEGRYSGRYAV